MTKEQPNTITAINSAEFLKWRGGSECLFIEGEWFRLTLEPPVDLTAAHEALQNVFCRLLAFEVADLRKALEEDY